MLCGVRPADWSRVAEAAAAWPGTVAAFGIHPWHADEAGERGQLAAMLQNSTAWVGEIGLDGLRTDRAGEETQQAVFAWQLRLAAGLGRRVNLHCVRAWEPLIAGLDGEYLAHGGREGFILHAFAGPHQHIEALRRRGAYFTVGPLALRRDSRRQSARARLLPEDRLLLESDAFLLPGRDGTEELRSTLAWLAGVRGMSVETLSERIEENVRRLFADA
jgi:TatD DNase family protein